MITGTYYINCNTTDKRYTVRKREMNEDVKSFKSWDAATKFVEDAELAELKTPRKRKKTVFPTNEVPHLWAHKVQDSARNAQGNLYFDGEVIYSYGSHFPIARHITNAKGKPAVLFTEQGYSSTTSGHKSAVHSAIPSGLPVFTVPELGLKWDCNLDSAHVANLRYFQAQIDEAIEKSARARSNGEWLLKSAGEHRDTMRKYAQFFGIKNVRPKFPTGAKLAKLQATIRERIKRDKIVNAARMEREHIARAERERIAALELTEKIALWRANDPNVSSWQVSAAPAMLRITGNEVETSKGARFPVSHAKRGLAVVRACMSSNREYVRNGHTVHLGHYPLDRVEVNGTVHAGCHVVTWAEIERIAPQLDAITESEQPAV